MLLPALRRQQNHREGFPSWTGKAGSYLIKGLNIPHPSFHTPDTVNVVIMGDMMMHRDQISNARTGEDTFDFSECFPKVEHLIKEADIAVANMEFTLAESLTPAIHVSRRRTATPKASPEAEWTYS